MTTDDALRAMFIAYAGPAEPSVRPRSRRITTRTVVLLAATVAVCGALVPAGRALVHTFFETPKQFIHDKSQPKRARVLIERFLAENHFFRFKLTGVEPELTARTPAGEYGIYGLRFAGGQVGSAVVRLAPAGGGGLWVGEPIDCPPGWAIQLRGSFVRSPGHSPVFIEGRVSPAVASVDVELSDGRTNRAAIGNGYLLAWLPPGPNGGRPGGTLVARNAAGARIGALYVRSDGDIPPPIRPYPLCG